MTEQEQNLAIAEMVLTGFQWRLRDDGTVVITGQGDTYQESPNYLSDLNACHEMENCLPEDLKFKFAEHLADIMDADFGSFVHIHAPAPARCKAFLKTLGKWRDD